MPILGLLHPQRWAQCPRCHTWIVRGTECERCLAWERARYYAPRPQKGRYPPSWPTYGSPDTLPTGGPWPSVPAVVEDEAIEQCPRCQRWVMRKGINTATGACIACTPRPPAPHPARPERAAEGSGGDATPEGLELCPGRGLGAHFVPDLDRMTRLCYECLGVRLRLHAPGWPGRSPGKERHAGFVPASDAADGAVDAGVDAAARVSPTPPNPPSKVSIRERMKRALDEARVRFEAVREAWDEKTRMRRMSPAEKWLRDEFRRRGRELDAAGTLRRAREAGFSETQIRRARDNMFVTVDKRGWTGGWWWIWDDSFGGFGVSPEPPSSAPERQQGTDAPPDSEPAPEDGGEKDTASE